jgi:hypothetical protein
MKALGSTHILSRIVEAKRQRLERTRMRVPEAVVKHFAFKAPAAPSLVTRSRMPGPFAFLPKSRRRHHQGCVQAELLRFRPRGLLYERRSLCDIGGD